MHTNSRQLLAFFMAASLCEACSLSAGEEAAQALDTRHIDERAAQIAPQGLSMQGLSMQGLSMQGLSMQGLSMQGLSMQGVSFNGVAFNGVALVGTSFSGNWRGVPLSGASFIGATMTGFLSDSTEVSLRIDNIETTGDPDILYYTVSYYDAGWRNLCGVNGDGTLIKAIPLAGTWDESQGTPQGGSYTDNPSLFTFGCRSAVLAKCVEFGYKPWKTVEECSGQDCHDIPLRHFHQACTRMMREDLCGDGTPHTANGTHINLWDKLGIQEEDPSVSWPLEAEWTPKGAKCMNHVRWTTNGAEGAALTQSYVDAHCPAIDSKEALSTCGAASSTFETSVGFPVPYEDRALLRNDSVAPPSDP